MSSRWSLPWRWPGNKQLHILRLGVALLSIALCLLVGHLFPRAASWVQEHGTDAVWRFAASPALEQRVIFVDIDDASLARVGPWPWGRDVMAQLVTQLDEQGASLKLFDIVFPDRRENSESFIRALAANDATSPNILGQLFAIRNETTLSMGQPVQPAAFERCPDVAVPAQGQIANMPGLHRRAGHITPALDPDGTVRRIPALICHDHQVWPALALSGLAAAASTVEQSSQFVLEQGHHLLGPPWRLYVPGPQGYSIGLDASGYVRVPFSHARGSWLAVSAADVLDGKVPENLLQGAWVIVGATAFGLSDTIPTALGGAVSGAEVHAQLLVGMLDGRVPLTPKGEWLIQAGYAAVAVVALLLLAAGHPLQQGRWVLLLPVAGLVASLAAYGLHALLLIGWSLYIGWLWPAASAFLFGIALGGLEHARSLHHKSRLFGNLASYIPVSVAERIAFNPPNSDIQAERVKVTILVADIRNFTAYSEVRSPEETARVLHHFYTTASEIVVAHGGIVEEMVGDSLLAVFNGPRPCPDHAAQALAAARHMWQQCGENLPNVYGQGLEPLALGIGVETGEALAGSFGSSGRRVHTVLGKPVTVALRLCEMTADLAYPILAGEATASHLVSRLDSPELLLKPLGSFLLPGMHNSGKIYTFRHWQPPFGEPPAHLQPATTQSHPVHLA